MPPVIFNVDFFVFWIERETWKTYFTLVSVIITIDVFVVEMLSIEVKYTNEEGIHP